MKIAMACDHGAVELKNKLKAHLQEKGMEVVDFGTHTTDSCDYPDYIAPAAQAVASGECDRGIVLCTTGIGVSIVANKIKGIRCALLSDTMTARLTREHNDTNMMALGAGVTGPMLAQEIVDVWLATDFSHSERHQRRIDKVMALEKL
ncbi:MAG TPA: ribose 5-phosphate isomerase B [Candidatus Faecousia excrementipullorum]|nr:ribose 5-phosphate isomerase B [Candidatus Faecousia excrementipullorum]